MVTKFLRKAKTSRRGVTPALATMILLSSTLALSLVVGAYTSGLFSPNITRIQLTSIQLFDGLTTDNVSVTASASLNFILKNPGTAVNVSSVQLVSTALQSPISSWSITPTAMSGNSFLVGAHNALGPGKSVSFTLYPITSPPISMNAGQTFDYYIQFTNGQSISGAILVN